MRILAIKQPWASLILAGIKRVENRSWTVGYRGPILIHAAKTGTAEDMEDGRRLCARLGKKMPTDFPTGGIIGIVDFNGTIQVRGFAVETDHPYIKVTQASGWNTRQVGWIFDNPRKLPLIPGRGRLGLTIPDRKTQEKVAKALETKKRPA